MRRRSKPRRHLARSSLAFATIAMAICSCANDETSPSSSATPGATPSSSGYSTVSPTPQEEGAATVSVVRAARSFGDPLALTPDGAPVIDVLPLASEASVIVTRDPATASMAADIVDAAGVRVAQVDTDGCQPHTTVLGGQPVASIITFARHPAEGVVEASYDVLLKTFDNTGATVSTVPVTEGLKGEPRCVEPTGHFPWFDVNEWGAISSANGEWVALAFKRGENDWGSYLVSPQYNKSRFIEGFASRVDGNHLLHECKPPAGSDTADCVSSWQNPAGRVAYSSLATNPIIKEKSYCSQADANCHVTSTGDPQGTYIVSGPPSEAGGVTDTLGTGESATDHTDLKAWSFIRNAAFHKSSAVIAVSAQKRGSNEGEEFIVGLNRKGATIWDIAVKNGKVCGATNQGFIIATNSQLALLEPMSGRQVDFTQNNDGKCPRVIESGLAGGPQGVISLHSRKAP